MERIQSFLPSIFMVAGIAGLVFITLKVLVRYFGSDFKDPKWHKNNEIMLFALVSAPTQFILLPCVFALLFCAPIIIAFETLSLEAWYATLFSCMVSAVVISFGSRFWYPKFLIPPKIDEDEIVASNVKIPKWMTKEKIAKATIVASSALNVFMIGLAGAIGIKYQSIGASVFVVAIVEVAEIILIPTVMFGVMLIVVVLEILLFWLNRFWKFLIHKWV